MTSTVVHVVTTQSVQSLAIASVVGLLSGTHTAIWGMYKDAVHEGFAARRFARSVVLGALAALTIQASFQLPLPDAKALVLLFGLAYAAERGMVEVWKTFVRQEDQSKYFIPMQFSVRGVPLESRTARIAVGASYVAAVAACLLVIARLNAGASTLPTAVRAALVGLVVGVIVAIGGSWKDAPKEGFDLLKFFRSPAVTVLYALVFAQLTDSYIYIAAASVGYERATVETYKKFFFPMKPPGKFAGKPVLHPHMIARRRYFVPPYLAISVTALLCVVLAVWT
jgi:hypothetical protein